MSKPAPKDDTITKQDEVTQQAPAEQQTGGAVALYDPGEDAGAGMENVGADEQVIPFFQIIQTNSPQVEKGNAKYVEGCKPSNIINLATGQFVEAFEPDGAAGMEFIPCYRDHYFAEFTPRDYGGGFHGIHPADDARILKLQREQKAEFKKIKANANDETSNDFIDTFVLYGLHVQRDEAKNPIMMSRGILLFKSTQISKYRATISLLDSIKYPGPGGKLIQPAMWAHRLRVRSGPDKNKKGSYFGWRLTLFEGNAVTVRSRLDMTDDVYQAAKQFNALIKAGKVKGDYAGEAAEDAAAKPHDDDVETDF